MKKNIWADGSGSLMLILVLVSLQLNAIAGASLGIGSSGDGLGGSLTAYNEDDSDRVFTHSLDAQNGGDSSDGGGEYSDPNRVIKTVININDSNAAALLLNFNVSKDDILRRISAQQPMQAVTAADTHADDETNATTMEGVSEQRE